MHFSLSALSALAVVASLTAPGAAFVMDTYSSKDCSGKRVNNVNVWDNTCATWPSGFKSFKLRVYGGKHQKAYFFTPNNCGSLPGAIASHWADGGGFKTGKCYSFGDRVANAVASYSG